MPHFLCRLNPPRPDFAVTMTPDETALMGQHAEYLSRLAASGEVLIFGPVLDPKGPWGLAVLDVAEKAAAETITAADPLIGSGRGFSYDVMPFLSAGLGRQVVQRQQEAPSAA